MDTNQQQFENLRAAIESEQPVEHLVNEQLLSISDAYGRRPLHWAVQRHNVANVKLLISVYPEALVQFVDGRNILVFCHKARGNNDNDIHRVVGSCWLNYKEHRFSRFIELCGTSEALEALDAAHSQNDLSLSVICLRKLFNKALANMDLLSAHAAVAEIFWLGEDGYTAFASAMRHMLRLRCWRA